MLFLAQMKDSESRLKESKELVEKLQSKCSIESSTFIPVYI